MSQQPDIQAVKDYLIGLQERICQRLDRCQLYRVDR